MHLGERVDTAGTADEDLAVIFGIEVDEAFRLQHAVLQSHSAGESGLFIDGEEAFDSRVLEVGVGDRCKRHTDTDTIVRTERCSFGFQPFAVHVGQDRVGHEIMLYIAVLLTYHIHVRLKDDTLMVFVSGRRGYAHDDIHRFIRYALDMMRSRKILQPLTDLLLVFRRTRHLIDLRKDLKNCFRFHIFFQFNS